MGASRRFLSALQVAPACFFAVAPASGQEHELRLTCLLGEAPALVGERQVSSESGRENRLRLSWTRSDLGWWPAVETHVRLRLELELDGLRRGAGPVIRDGGSALGLDLRLGAVSRLRLRAFPLDTDDERLGYLHALDWGGSDVERGESIFVAQQGSVPGVELGLVGAAVEVSAGLRWADAGAAAPERRLWGALLRGRINPRGAVGADFGLGFFQRVAPTPGGIASAAGFVEGASFRLVWRHGERPEPELGVEPFRPPTLKDANALLVEPEAAGAGVALEGVVLVTRKRRFEVPSEQQLQPAPAAALSGSVRGALLAGHAALTWRSLPFVQRNGVGLRGDETAPAGAVERPELAVWAGASLRTDSGVVPSLELGALLPAALVTPSVLPGFPQSFVVRENGVVVTLPVGSERLPILASRAAVRVALSPSLSLAAFFGYERDPNRVRFRASPLGTERAFAPPDSFGVGAAALAHF